MKPRPTDLREIERLEAELAAAREERDALSELQPFPVETVMAWKRRAENAERMNVAAREREAKLRKEVDRQLGRHLCYTAAGSRQRFWREVDAALADGGEQT